MTLSTPGLVLHTTPYGESSVVAHIFTRQSGVRSYIIKGVRGTRSRIKQNMLQPLSCLDMVVYDNHRGDLNNVKELSLRHPGHQSEPVANALRFFMTEVLYKTLSEAEPMPDLWDYVEQCSELVSTNPEIPIRFLLNVAHYMGIEPLDNHTPHHPYFDLQEGRFVAEPTETTLPPALSSMLHEYLSNSNFHLSSFNLTERRSLIDALIAYYQLHLSGFRNFNSHEILHTILK
jgi:DNA repair protein RecO (recombination protein O)